MVTAIFVTQRFVGGLGTISLKKRIRQLSKNVYKTVYNTPNQIIAELPDLEVSDPANHKRSGKPRSGNLSYHLIKAYNYMILLNDDD